MKLVKRMLFVVTLSALSIPVMAADSEFHEPDPYHSGFPDNYAAAADDAIWRDTAVGFGGLGATLLTEKFLANPDRLSRQMATDELVNASEENKKLWAERKALRADLNSVEGMKLKTLEWNIQTRAEVIKRDAEKILVGSPGLTLIEKEAKLFKIAKLSSMFFIGSAAVRIVNGTNWKDPGYKSDSSAIVSRRSEIDKVLKSGRPPAPIHSLQESRPEESGETSMQSQ